MPPNAGPLTVPTPPAPISHTPQKSRSQNFCCEQPKIWPRRPFDSLLDAVIEAFCSPKAGLDLAKARNPKPPGKSPAIDTELGPGRPSAEPPSGDGVAYTGHEDDGGIGDGAVLTKFSIITAAAVHSGYLTALSFLAAPETPLHTEKDPSECRTLPPYSTPLPSPGDARKPYCYGLPHYYRAVLTNRIAPVWSRVFFFAHSDCIIEHHLPNYYTCESPGGWGRGSLSTYRIDVYLVAIYLVWCEDLTTTCEILKPRQSARC
ncbi:hypothetical protein EDC01DRAFT_631112 [Geopyxis carbonaria]|nr:hypothetical protein EDC01DRAFT_631112 [Geopyxis carbonaria]